MNPDRALRKLMCLGGIVAAAAFAGCASQPASRMAPAPSSPPDPTVYFYPAAGQSAEQQDRDHYECNEWAVQQTGFDPSSPNVPPHLHVRVDAGPPAGADVAAGALTGAVVGATVSRPWEAGQGAIAGAIAGAAIGGIADAARTDQARQDSLATANSAQAALLEQRARNYRRAMSACLEGRGYNVR
ncbi:MAG: glycine zipper family protein [Steroidobacteraceae bacterium]